MLSNSQQQQPGRGAPQGFAAAPRVVQAKTKYKDPYGHVGAEEYTPHNIMYDKRVFRGSTNAAMVIPAGTYPDKLFHSNKTKFNKGDIEDQRAKAAEEFFTRDVKTPEAPPGKQNIDIQTDQFVSELTDKAPVYEIGCQTAFKIERPPTAHRMPKLTGVSKKTLVEDNELFIFDDDVEPLLSVICGKTLEQARMEVLEEEELRLMKRQQDHYADLQKTELNDIQRIEEEERVRLATYENKKKAETRARQRRIDAHEKVISRVMAKQYLAGLKPVVYNFMNDMSFFQDKEKEKIVTDVMPWLYSESQKFTDNLGSYEQYPSRMIVEFMADEVNEHKETVKKHRQMVENKELEAKRAAEKKVQDQIERRARRAAKKKAAEIAKLREDIEATFIGKGVPTEEILKSPLVEADGYGTKETPVIGVFGGWLGQCMMVFQTLARKYPTLDRDRKSGSSRKGTPKSSKSNQGDTIDSQVKGERRLINAQVVQTFMYNYVEKMKMDALIMNVDPSFERKLKGLKRPIALNDMHHNILEGPYQELRKILTNKMGDPILQLMKENQKELGFDQDVFDLVYEGFWDLYMMREKCDECPNIRKKTWIARFMMQANSDGTEPDAEAEAEAVEDDEEVKADKPDGEVLSDSADQAPKIPDVSAIVRIRIPKKQPDPELDPETGDPLDPQPEINEDDLEEIEFEDKAFSVSVNVAGQQIWQFNQLAQRTLRNDMAAELKNYVEILETLDTDEFKIKLEKESQRMEDAFCTLFSEDSKVQSSAPKIPVFNFSPQF